MSAKYNNPLEIYKAASIPNLDKGEREGFGMGFVSLRGFREAGVFGFWFCQGFFFFFWKYISVALSFKVFLIISKILFL